MAAAMYFAHLASTIEKELRSNCRHMLPMKLFSLPDVPIVPIQPGKKRQNN
jgi:hypothetical protein